MTEKIKSTLNFKGQDLRAVSVEEQKVGAQSFQRGLYDASLMAALSDEKEVVYCTLAITYNA